MGKNVILQRLPPGNVMYKFDINSTEEKEKMICEVVLVSAPKRKLHASEGGG